jgi:hypothetical protein
MISALHRQQHLSNMTDPDHDQLWEMRTCSDTRHDTYTKFYSPSEHPAVEEVIVLFKGQVIFKQYITKKHKCFGIKIYRLCHNTGYT